MTRRMRSTPLVAATGGLVVLVLGLAWFEDVRIAARVLSLGLVVAAVARLLLHERAVFAARGRRFDVTVLLVLAVAAFLLAPWGLAQVPS